MNVNKILTLADIVENSSHFNMANWRYCILGHISFITDYNTKFKHETYVEYGIRVLGISYEQGVDLFLMNSAIPFPDSDTNNAMQANCDYMKRITPKQAANVLRHLAITGKVDWKAIDTVEVNTALPPFKVPVRNRMLDMIRELVS